MVTMRSLRWLQRILNRVRWYLNTRVWGMDIDSTAIISLKARLDRTNPTGVHIGAYTYITLGVCVLAHDMCRNYRADTRIGDNCFIGIGAIILPGVNIGDGSIVAAGSVVTKDVQPASVVAGNPAKVLYSGVKVGRYGVIIRNISDANPSSQKF